MICFLTTQEHDYTFEIFRRRREEMLGEHVVQRSYTEVLGADVELPPGRVVFTDLERLSTMALTAAEELWGRLAKEAPERLPLNRPGRVLRRFEMLRTLALLGRNDFDVYRVTDLRMPKRFPAFMRGEFDHRGALSTLIEGPDQYRALRAHMLREGMVRDDKMLVEFCDTRDERGRYVKYGAFRIGDRIIPRHRFVSREWVLKDPDLRDEQIDAAEDEYLETNPHADDLMALFEIANIDYGRIDYGFKDGKIQVWEINTNPVIARQWSEGDSPKPRTRRFLDQLAEAVLAIPA